jgi:uncharacterized OB-fold protein
VYTYTVIRQYGQKPFAEELPYCLVMVDLDDVPVRLFGTLTGVAPDDVRVDLPVEAYAVEYEPGRAVPYWRPV